MKVLVSPKEKPYVFKALDQAGVPYIKKEFTVWVCKGCNKIFTEKVEKCEYKRMPGEYEEIFGCGSTDLYSMSIADFVGEKLNYAIERKGGSDLYHSLDEDRIYLQLQAMKEVFKDNIGLLFEGSFDEVAKKERIRVRILARKLRAKNKFSKAQKVITSCESRIKQMLSLPAHCMSLGISFIQVDDILTFLKMLKYFDYKCGKAPKIREKKKSLSSLMPSVVKKLTTTEGIGEKLALEVFKFAKTPRELVELLKRNPNKLLNIRGLGTVKLANIVGDWL